MIGHIFDIAHGSFVDGPGIRTTVFCKGCDLRCRWCHNPESHSPKPQRLFYRDKCVDCGLCRTVCPSPHHCILCGRCADICPQRASVLSGREITADELLETILRDRDFYGETGGVTFSGGECMCQMDFLTEMLQRCRQHHISTAVDTAGHAPWTDFVRILPYTDIFLYDIKCVSEDIHRAYTGVSNRRILDNLHRLSEAFTGHIYIRTPLIPGVNDTLEEMKKLRDLLHTLRYESHELLPYHPMGEDKFTALGRECNRFPIPDATTVAQWKSFLAE